jgi:hypothetical protein
MVVAKLTSPVLECSDRKTPLNLAKGSHRFNKRGDVATPLFRYKYTGVLGRDKLGP